MKKFVAGLMLAIVAVSTLGFTNIYAEGDVVSDFKTEMTDLKTGSSQKMMNTLNEGVIAGDSSTQVNSNASIKEYSFKNAYRVQITDTLIITAFQQDKKVSDLGTEEYEWVVPITNSSGESGYAILKENGVNFDLIDVVIDEDSTRLMVTIDNAINNVKSNADGTVEDIEIYYSELYDTTLVYFSDKDGEHIIQYSDISEETGIENEKCFKAEKYFKKLNKKFNEKRYDESKGELPYRVHYFKIILIVIVCIGILVGVVFGILKAIQVQKRKFTYGE